MVRSYPHCFGDAEIETYLCSVECPYYNRCLKETFMRCNPELVMLIDDSQVLSVRRRNDAIAFAEKHWVKKL